MRDTRLISINQILHQSKRKASDRTDKVSLERVKKKLLRRDFIELDGVRNDNDNDDAGRAYDRTQDLVRITFADWKSRMLRTRDNQLHHETLLVIASES